MLEFDHLRDEQFEVTQALAERVVADGPSECS